MKLNYSSRRRVTTADFFMQCEPPLIFEVRVKPGPEWAALFGDFETNGSNDPEAARALIAMLFLTVSDGGEVYPLAHVDQAQSLQDAIEEADPGNGENFICDLAWSSGANYFRYIGDHLGNSLRPLEQFNGKAENKIPAKAS